ncbi:hypothetical protein EW146_g1342 [Bondarzewia mesenterica]|uniref:AAA+ ATPase domain-containing protein n=1 Tax=Bondarzewia mesenterica TaxID=1095465 RepID=A0A4S4M5K5_9AGAM|nr:hypothetical protein EW146_g1342 [Bondarzewia mesenterica]
MNPTTAMRPYISRHAQRRLLSIRHPARLRSPSPSPSRPLSPIPGSRGRAYNSSLAAASSSSNSDIEASILHGKPHLHGTSSPPSQAGEGSSTPMQQYQALIDSGTLHPDDYQTRIIQKLQDLHDALVTYTPPPLPSTHPSSSILSRLFSRPAEPTSHTSNAPLGLYLYGDVGTGKTMLMDLFFRTLPPNVTRKRRVHFHAFMIDVHKRLHAAKRRMGYEGGDSIIPVARELAEEASVLCFDEFQVTDIADAMILRRLLENLLDYGVIFVITSNRHPDELYKNGIQRSSFIPAIELLKTRFDVTDLDSGTDYRRIPRALSHVYHHPLNSSTHNEMHKLFDTLTASETVKHGRELTIWGRSLRVPKSTSDIAMFEFEDLCGKPLSAADYLEITRAFGTVFLCDVPMMGLGEKDKTKLFVSSEVPIYRIFSDDKSTKGDMSDHMRSVMDDLGLSSDVVGASSMFSGEEELFAFARCCSRLVQMGSRDWVETAGVR